jgi:hypothetical protein
MNLSRSMDVARQSSTERAFGIEKAQSTYCQAYRGYQRG